MRSRCAGGPEGGRQGGGSRGRHEACLRSPGGCPAAGTCPVLISAPLPGCCSRAVPQAACAEPAAPAHSLAYAAYRPPVPVLASAPPQVIQGALDMASKHASDAMTPMDKVGQGRGREGRAGWEAGRGAPRRDACRRARWACEAPPGLLAPRPCPRSETSGRSRVWPRRPTTPSRLSSAHLLCVALHHTSPHRSSCSPLMPRSTTSCCWPSCSAATRGCRCTRAMTSRWGAGGGCC